MTKNKIFAHLLRPWSKVCLALLVYHVGESLLGSIPICSTASAAIDYLFDPQEATMTDESVSVIFAPREVQIRDTSFDIDQSFPDGVFSSDSSRVCLDAT
jgi:hypothetical protein